MIGVWFLWKYYGKNGADVNMKTKDYNGDSILKFAERRGTPAIVSKLKAKGAK